MKKLTKLMCILSMLFIITGCGGVPIDENNSVTKIGIIGGDMLNQPGYDYSDQSFTDLISDGLAGRVNITIVSPDGIPSQNTDSLEYTEKLSGSSVKYDLEYRVEDLTNLIEEVKAKVSQNNLFTAIHYLGEKFDGEEATIYIFNSGLNTSDPCNLSLADSLEALVGTENQIVKDLEDNGFVIDLSKVKVVMYNIGQVADQQKELNPNGKQFLKNLYAKYFEACGTTVEFKTVSTISTDHSSLPEVSTIFVPELGTNFYTVFDSSSKVQFQYDSDQFVDQEAAKEALEVVVEQYNKTHESFVIASTSGKAIESAYNYQKDLAKRRGETIKQTLIELGIPSNKITAIVPLVAEESPWYKAVSDENATSDTSNRISVVLGADTNRAKYLVDGTYIDHLNEY